MPEMLLPLQLPALVPALVLVLVGIAMTAPSARACSSEMNCSLNGVCTDGSCRYSGTERALH